MEIVNDVLTYIGKAKTVGIDVGSTLYSVDTVADDGGIVVGNLIDIASGTVVFPANALNGPVHLTNHNPFIDIRLEVVAEIFCTFRQSVKTDLVIGLLTLTAATTAEQKYRGKKNKQFYRLH